MSSDVDADTVQRADPEEVDRETVMAMGDCPNCGEHSLGTAKVEDAVYIASCGHCDHELRAPVIDAGESAKVRFDMEPEEVPL